MTNQANIKPLEPKSAPTIEQIKLWEKTVNQIARLQKKEKEMRAAIVEAYFADREEGTNTFPLEGDLALKCGQSISRKINMDEFEILQQEQAKAGRNTPKIPLEILVNFKPSISVTAYRQLNPAQKSYFDRCITSTESLPTLALVNK